MVDFQIGNDQQPPDPPQLPSGLAGEIFNQIANSLARHALTWIGGALIALGWVSPDAFAAWVDVHAVEVAGVILTALAFLWSWAHKRQSARELVTAIKMRPIRYNGVQTSIEDVRRVAKQSEKKYPAALPALLCLLLVFGQTACWFGGATATEKFARANAELRIYVSEANTVVDSLLDLNAISPDAAIALVGGLRAVNASQKALLTEALKYLQTDSNGNETLVITEAGRLRLADLALSLVTVASNAVNDPLISRLPDESRARLATAFALIPPVILQLQALIKALKAKPVTAAPLRVQVSQTTAHQLRQVLAEVN